MLLGEEDTFPITCISLLRDFIDFVDGQSTPNISRAKLKASWASYTQRLERIKTKLDGKPELTVERMTNWIEHQVAATLAVYYHLGYSISSLMDERTARMRQRHKALLTFKHVPRTRLLI